MAEKLRIGIIGVGNISNAHIDSYRADPRVELYAFCDIDEKRLKLMGERFGITRLYSNLDDMLALPELDAVSVCTWNVSHAECAIKAMRAGKHVLCEKPMAVSVAEAEEMKRVSEETGKLLMIGFVRRFAKDSDILKDYREAGMLGDIYYGRMKNVRRHGNPGSWFADKARSGGGPLLDLGVHLIDLFCYWLGEDAQPVSVYGATFQKLYNRPEIKELPPYLAQAYTPDDPCDVEDMATALIRFNTDAVLQIEVAFTLNIPGAEQNSIEVFGTEGGATFNPELTLSRNLAGHMVDIKPQRSAQPDFTEAFRKEISHFVSCILDGTVCRNPAADGVRLMKILEAIYRSAETGHEVVIE